MMTKEFEVVIQNLLRKKSPGSDSFPGECHQTFQELITVLFKLFKKTEEDWILPNSFYEACITLIPKPDKARARK